MTSASAAPSAGRPVFTVHDLAKYELLLVLAWLHEQTVMRNRKVDVLVEHEQPMLKNALQKLFEQGYINLSEQGRYTLTPKGVAEIDAIEEKRKLIAQKYFVWDGVDINSPAVNGEDLRDRFAFRKYFDYRTDADWKLVERSNPRYEDVRLTVIYFQSLQTPESSLSILDVLFCVFLVDRKFNIEAEKWSLDLIDGVVWTGMLEIANSFYVPAQINGGDEDTMRAIIQTGFEVAKEMSMREEQIHAEREAADPTYEPTYFTEEVAYYEVVEEEAVLLPDPFLVGLAVGIVLL